MCLLAFWGHIHILFGKILSLWMCVGSVILLSFPKFRIIQLNPSFVAWHPFFVCQFIMFVGYISIFLGNHPNVHGLNPNHWYENISTIIVLLVLLCILQFDPNDWWSHSLLIFFHPLGTSKRRNVQGPRYASLATRWEQRLQRMRTTAVPRGEWDGPGLSHGGSPVTMGFNTKSWFRYV